MPITRSLPFMLEFFAFVALYSCSVLFFLGWRFSLGIPFRVVEPLKRVLGEAFVFIGIGQRDGGYALMPVSTVDQFVEFGQSVFEVVETAHALHRLLPLFNGNFEGHGSIAAAFKATPVLLCSR